MRLERLADEHVPSLLPWFDDPDTVSAVGDGMWLTGLLRFMRREPQRRFGWVAVRAWEHQPVAVADVELVDDTLAHVALVVAPRLRRQGIGRQVALLLAGRRELQGRTVEGWISERNPASHGLSRSLGLAEQDSEYPGFVRVVADVGVGVARV